MIGNKSIVVSTLCLFTTSNPMKTFIVTRGMHYVCPCLATLFSKPCTPNPDTVHTHMHRKQRNPCCKAQIEKRFLNEVNRKTEPKTSTPKFSYRFTSSSAVFRTEARDLLSQPRAARAVGWGKGNRLQYGVLNNLNGVSGYRIL